MLCHWKQIRNLHPMPAVCNKIPHLPVILRGITDCQAQVEHACPTRTKQPFLSYFSRNRNWNTPLAPLAVLAVTLVGAVTSPVEFTAPSSVQSSHQFARLPLLSTR